MAQEHRSRLPFGLSIEALFEWGYRVILFFCVLGLIYLKSIFATHEEVAPVIADVAQLTPKVAAIETAQSQTAQVLSAIQTDLSAVRATQKEAAKNTDKNFDRIFNKLDGLSSNPGR